MKMRNLLMAAVLGASLLGMVGCNGGGGGSVTTGGTYSQAWYDVYGYYCGSGLPRPGCNFFADGYKIRDYEDPYYSYGRTLYLSTWYYTDSYGYSRSYYGWGWLSDTGILYDDYGYALNEEGSNHEGYDWYGESAKQEELVVNTVGKDFAAKYALAEDTGVKIAKTLNDWATLAKTRSRTDEDVAAFSKRLFGINIETAKNAIAEAKKGNLKPMEEANNAVAAYWGTRPETSKEILKSWYAEQAKELNQ